MKQPPVLLVDQVSKSYPIYDKPEDRLKQIILPRICRALGATEQRFYREHRALDNVSLTLHAGETLGIVGRNGSGKSTLLQIICGTLAPTSGTVERNGRVTGLLELGSGFNPDFTGRENVYLNAAILGFSKNETDSKFSAIEAFAEIGEFIDMPIKTYSSGMVVRLAFAVQAQMSPDVLIIDEALAVGDAKFQAKCFARLEDLKRTGTAMILVTHSTEQVVTHCDRALLIEQGAIADQGEPRLIINRYLDMLYGRASGGMREAIEAEKPLAIGQSHSELAQLDPAFTSHTADNFCRRPLYNAGEYRWGDRRAEIIDYLVVSEGRMFPTTIRSGSIARFYLRYLFNGNVTRPILGFTIKTKEGVTMYGTNSEMGRLIGEVPPGRPGSSFTAFFEVTLPCGVGDYFVSVGLASRDLDGNVVPHDRRYDSIHLHVDQEFTFSGLCDFQGRCEVYG